MPQLLLTPHCFNVKLPRSKGYAEFQVVYMPFTDIFP